MITLETPRLLIRNFTMDDAPALREIAICKESGEYADYDNEWPTSEQEIEWLLARYAGYDGLLAICLKDTGLPIGFLSFDRTGDDELPAFDLGYCLHPDFQHLGYTTEAAASTIDYAFATLAASRIRAGTAAVNAPSLGVLRRLGMRKVGEETVAFRKTADGAPIEFTGFMFELSRDK